MRFLDSLAVGVCTVYWYRFCLGYTSRLCKFFVRKSSDNQEWRIHFVSFRNNW